MSNQLRDTERRQHRIPDRGDGPVDIVLVPGFISHLEFAKLGVTSRAELAAEATRRNA